MKSKIRTAKEMFAAIHDFFDDMSVDDKETEKVYDAMAGVRGPDEFLGKHADKKRATSAVIRHRVFGNQCPAQAGIDTDKNAEVRKQLEQEFGLEDEHFVTHARQAFKALGLAWDKNNDERPKPKKWKGKQKGKKVTKKKGGKKVR